MLFDELGATIKVSRFYLSRFGTCWPGVGVQPSSHDTDHRLALLLTPTAILVHAQQLVDGLLAGPLRPF